MAKNFVDCPCKKREKGESLIFVIEKLLIIHIGLGYIYTC